MMRHTTLAAIAAFALFAACSPQIASRTVVEGAGPDELLKLRSGPGLGFNIIIGLPDGTELRRRECVTEVGQLWCKVSLQDAPQVTGYVPQIIYPSGDGAKVTTS